VPSPSVSVPGLNAMLEPTMIEESNKGHPLFIDSSFASKYTRVEVTYGNKHYITLPRCNEKLITTKMFLAQASLVQEETKDP
jgi:hypothetical protein